MGKLADDLYPLLERDLYGWTGSEARGARNDAVRFFNVHIRPLLDELDAAREALTVARKEIMALRTIRSGYQKGKTEFVVVGERELARAKMKGE